MKGMKMLKSAAALIAVSALTAQCSLLGLEEEENNDALLALALIAGSGSNSCTTYCPDSSSFVTKSGTISSSETWGNCTALDGTVFIQSGVTVTIPAGSCVQGRSGSSLFVLNGADIIANGTAGSPIIFTSSQATGSRAPADWGGLVIIGDATASKSDNTEGTAPQAYGAGSTDSDSSGSLTYARFEYAGFEVATDQELNALSMYTVGSGTTLSYLQAHMTKDDGFEWFGGAANADHLVGSGVGDDAFDADRGYRGTLSYLIDYRYPQSSGVSISSNPRGFEMDGADNGGSCDANSRCSQVTISNFTLVGLNSDYSNTDHQGMYFTEGLTVTSLSNGVVVGYAELGEVEGKDAGATTTLNCGSNLRSDFTSFTDNDNGGTATLNGCGSVTSTNRSSVVVSDWSESNPSAAPVFFTLANSATDSDWYSSWTYWVNK
ncbi:MAG: hypothetical protein CMF59_09550 [Leptospiraceae bacterium]|nr:hypothetical protein [Leptospiraceae bacterium]